MEQDTPNRPAEWKHLNRTTFKTFKAPLKSVMKDPECVARIEEFVFKINDLVFHSYQFIKCYVLFNFDRPEPVFIDIDDHLIGYSIRVLGFCRESNKRSNQELYESLEKYYFEHYQPATQHRRMNLEETAKMRANLVVQIKTMISNNIQERFNQHFRRFVNKMTYDKENPIPKSTLTRLKKRLLNMDFEEIEPEFSHFIDFVMSFVPADITKSIEYDVKERPLLYLKGMLLMNRRLEDKGLHCFRELPLSDRNVPRNIMLDTSTLIDSLVTVDKKKAEIFSSVNEHKNDVWDAVLNMKHKIFKSTNYEFYHQITTDGISCSLLFIRKGIKRKRGQVLDPKVSEFVFPKLDDQTDLEDIRGRLVGCDPGKRSLVYLSDGKRKLQYTNPQRRVEGRMKYGALAAYNLRTEKNKVGDESVQEYEGNLNAYKSNTTYHMEFLEYCYAKTRVRNETASFYRQSVFRKIRLRSFIYTRKSVDGFINKIGQTFGQDTVIAYGNWSRTDQMKGCAPSPGIGLRRLIHRKYRTLTTDEYLTSKLCSECGSRMKNHRIQRKIKGHILKFRLHRLMCCTECVSSESKRVAFRSRDLNAAKNIYQIGVHFCDFRERHPWYSRANRPSEKT
jgi:hypothetical protein